jgi:hypothetical protein
MKIALTLFAFLGLLACKSPTPTPIPLVLEKVMASPPPAVVRATIPTPLPVPQPEMERVGEITEVPVSIPVLDNKPTIPKMVFGKLKIKPTAPTLSKTPSIDMDAMRVEFSTTRFFVGTPFVVSVLISDGATLKSIQISSGSILQPLGIDQIPKSLYYLVAISGSPTSSFDIKPQPGTEQIQHRAMTGYAATWRYEVLPIVSGDKQVLLTLKTFQENDQAGTNIAVKPIPIQVERNAYSYWFILLSWLRAGGWAIVAGLLPMLAGAEWWRRWRKSDKDKNIIHTPD